MNKIFKYAVAGSLVLGLASCLKDEGFDNGTTGHDLSSVPKIIEIGFQNESGKSKTFAYNFADLAVESTVFYVRLAAATVAPEDITVTLDTTGTAAALAAINPAYKPLPASFFTTNPAGFTVTIPKGQSQVAFKVKTNAIQFDPSTTYGLVYKIKAVSSPNYNISGNYGTYTILFGAKNKYDGEYRMNSFHNRPGYQLLLKDEPMELVTTAGNEVAFHWPQVGGVGHPIMAPTGISWYGATVAPSIVFDPNTNLVTSVYNTAVAAGGPPIDIMTGAGAGISRYDAATKTVYVYFRYNANDARGFLDTLWYVGPRQ